MPRRRSSAFTILELMIAVVLVLLLSGLVLVSSGGAVRAASVSATEDVLTSALRLSRAEALRSQQALRLVLRASGDLVLEEITLARPADPGTPTGEPDQPEAIDLNIALPRGWTLAPASDAPATSPAPERATTRAQSPRAEARALALVLPGGEVHATLDAAGALQLSGPSGDRFTLRINTWTLGVRLRPEAGSAAPGADPPSAASSMTSVPVDSGDGP